MELTINTTGNVGTLTAKWDMKDNTVHITVMNWKGIESLVPIPKEALKSLAKAL